VVLWPLYQTYQHQRMLCNRLAHLTKLTRLTDIIAIPDAYEGAVPSKIMLCLLCIPYGSQNDMLL
jgi:hypothetical protein